MPRFKIIEGGKSYQGKEHPINREIALLPEDVAKKKAFIYWHKYKRVFDKIEHGLKNNTLNKIQTRWLTNLRDNYWEQFQLYWGMHQVYVKRSLKSFFGGENTS